MSTSMTFQNKMFVRPPDKGSFPLDHQGECKQFMFNYMRCLRQNKQENSKCRTESKEYLECRMQRNLMAKEDLGKLGYAEAGVEPGGSSVSGDTPQTHQGQS